MEKKTYAILDIAKFMSALLVIAVHCAPFIQVDETLNFAYVQIIARLAVPFFFLTSGFLFFQRIDPKKGRKDETNRKAYHHYWLRIFKIYIIWSLLYMPLLAYAWIQGGFDMTTLMRLGRDFLCTGTYYHLWFLPALLLGVPLVYYAYTSWKKRTLLLVTFLLYMIGMAVNVYGALLQDIPFIGTLLERYEVVFMTTRNGFFFAPVFLVLGIYAQDFITGTYKKPAFLAFLISFLLLIGEATWLVDVQLMHDLTSMYAMLLPCVFFLFIWLLQWDIKVRPIHKRLRNIALLVYVSHIYFIYIFLSLCNMNNLLVYVLSIVCSCILSYGILYASKRLTWLKVLY